MSFFAYLIKSEKISALHIAEESIAAASFVRKDKKLSSVRIVRRPLPEGCVVDGRIADEKTFIRVLREVRSRSGAHPHVVVAIPNPVVFGKTIAFPQKLTDSLDEEHIVEATNLALEWNVPFAPNDRYADVDMLGGSFRGVHISAAKKQDMDQYLAALTKAGFKPAAIEPEAAALARTLDRSKDVITTIEHERHHDIIVCREGVNIFSASYPKNAFKTKKAWADEVRRVAEFIASDFDKPPVSKPLDKLAFQDEVAREIDARKDHSLAPLFGELLRARLPRRDDVAASLMPIGTEQAYEYQKLEGFVGALGTLTLVTAFIITATSFTVWYGARTYANALPRTDILSDSVDIEVALADRKEDFDRFSAVVQTSGALAAEEHSFAKLTAFIRRYAIGGIALRNISIGNLSEPIKIAGIASSRTHLNTFLNGLRAAPEVASVDLPIANAELRGDIPFTMSISLRSPDDWQTWTATTTSK